MAGPSRYTAVLDACVLYPATVRDALMSLHNAGLFAAKWSAEIEGEWVRNLLARRSHITEAQLSRTCELMHTAVPDWEVANYKELIPGLSLPDKNDRHVLAAAIRGHADCIVTTNLRHFPADLVGKYDLEVFHPDDFIMLQLDLDSVDNMTGLKAMKAMRLRMRKPAQSPEEFVKRLDEVGLKRVAQRLLGSLELI